MSNTPKDKSVATKVMIVALPVVILLAAYFLLFKEKGIEQNQAPTPIENKTNGILDVEASEEDKKKSKSQIYDAEVNANFEKQKKLKNSNLDDIFASAEKPKEEPKISSEVGNNWGLEPKKEEVVTEVKPVTSPKKAKVKSSVPKPKPQEVKEQPKPSGPQRRTGFYSSSPMVQNETSNSNNNTTSNGAGGETTEGQIPCVVNNAHVIRSGQTVRIRSVTDFKINGVTIPKNTVFSGLASISGERVVITITAIKLDDQIIKCKYQVFDNDGVNGIYIPGGVNQEIARDGATQGLSVTTRIPVVGASITTGAGNKKIQDATVKIPSGYKVFIIKMEY